MRRRRNVRGSLVVVLVIGLAILMLMIPPLTQWFRKDAKDSVRFQKALQTTNLASAGLEKVEWRLNGDPALAAALMAGTAPAGFQGDVEYADIEGGVYKVDVVVGTNTHSTQFTLLVRAKDNRLNTVKAVQATYVKPEFRTATPVQYGLGGIFLNIHWSPVAVKYLSGGSVAVPSFPRILSGSYITNVDVSPVAPNSGVGWVSYDATLANLTAPVLDYSYYKQRAKGSVVPLATAGGALQVFPTHSDSVMFMPNGMSALANPLGSGYFSGTDNVLNKGVIGNDQMNFGFMNNGGGGYVLQNSTTVIFIGGREAGAETSVFFDTGSYLNIEALVVTGMSNQSYVYALGPGGGTVVASVPDGADAEYVTAAGAAVWTAGGAASMATAYANPGHCCYTINNVNMRGIVSTEKRNPTRYGGVFVGGIVARSNGTVFGSPSDPFQDTVYYDPVLMANLRTVNAPARLTWQEVAATW